MTENQDFFEKQMEEMIRSNKEARETQSRRLSALVHTVLAGENAPKSLGELANDILNEQTRELERRTGLHSEPSGIQPEEGET